MYYYFIGSKSKVVHLSNCAHMRDADRNRVSFFSSLESARKHGYRLCNHCAPINKFLNGHRAQLEAYCQQNGLLYRLEDGCICVQTPHSAWKIVMNGKTKKCIFLYHKNTYTTGDSGFVPGYHSQTVRRNSVLEYLEYINAHEAFRCKNPVAPMKQPVTPPQKGTKRWYKQQKRQQANQKRMAINQTLFLIEQISSKGESAYV